jgi:hypothetical protein
MTSHHGLTLCEYPEIISVICQIPSAVSAAGKQLNTQQLVPKR